MLDQLRNQVLAAAAAVLVAAPAFAITNGYSDKPPGTTDQYASGGCSGCFEARLTEALADFKTVTKVYRQVVRGANVSDDALDLDANAATKDRLQDFVLIEGTMWDKAEAGNPGGAGTPTAVGIATPVGLYVARISSNGSARGINCSKTVAPTNIGFIGPEGKDGIWNTADDAGCPAGGTPGVNCGYGFTGVGQGAGLARISAPVTDCGGNSAHDILALDAVIPATTSFVGAQAFCIIDDDQNADGLLAHANDGTTIGSAFLLEDSTIKVNCNVGFADLPTTDFSDPALNSSVFADGAVFGAQIMKLAVTKNVRAETDATKKIRLNDPQIEALFRAGNNSACHWREVGGDVPGSANNEAVTLCGRTAGSGTKEIQRLTWFRNAGGDQTESAANSVCARTIGGVATALTKEVTLGATTQEVVECLEGRFTANKGAIGYLDAARHPDTIPPKWYDVPVEGVDPETNDLKDLARCGHYRFWGPLSGGRRTAVDLIPISALEQAHRDGLKNIKIFNNVAPINADFPSYLPLSGVNFTKSTTDGSYSLNPIPAEADTCPPFPNAPANAP